MKDLLRELCDPETTDDRKTEIEIELTQRWDRRIDRVLEDRNRDREPGED